jgi:hypothetical protein
MLDPGALAGFDPAAALSLRGRRLAALALAVDVAGQLQGAQLCFHFLGPIRGIRPNAGPSTAWHQQVVDRLTVVHGRVTQVIAPDQLVLSVHVYVVLVAVMGLAMFLDPAGIDIFL